jgi:hypothetical protein
MAIRVENSRINRSEDNIEERPWRDKIIPNERIIWVEEHGHCYIRKLQSGNVSVRLPCIHKIHAYLKHPGTYGTVYLIILGTCVYCACDAQDVL